MGFVRKYSSLALGGVAAPQTLTGGGAAVATAGVPCKGARMVVFRLKATNSVAPSAVAANVGNSPLRAELWVNGNGGMLQARGNAAVRCDQTGGNTIAFICADARGTLAWDFLQAVVTPNVTGGQDTTGVTVDAEVYYDIDADLAVQVYGQAGLTVSAA